MSDTTSQSKTSNVAWGIMLAVIIMGWIAFMFWFVGYLSIRQYKASVKICREATTLDHYCPPEDAPLLDPKAFHNTLKADVEKYTQEKIREATQAATTSKRTIK